MSGNFDYDSVLCVFSLKICTLSTYISVSNIESVCRSIPALAPTLRTFVYEHCHMSMFLNKVIHLPELLQPSIPRSFHSDMETSLLPKDHHPGTAGRCCEPDLHISLDV